MRTASKTKIYKICLLPYGMEVRADINKNKTDTMLRIAEIKYEKTTTEKTPRKKVRNDEIRMFCCRCSEMGKAKETPLILSF